MIKNDKATFFWLPAISQNKGHAVNQIQSWHLLVSKRQGRSKSVSLSTQVKKCYDREGTGCFLIYISRQFPSSVATTITSPSALATAKETNNKSLSFNFQSAQTKSLSGFLFLNYLSWTSFVHHVSHFPRAIFWHCKIMYIHYKHI